MIWKERAQLVAARKILNSNATTRWFALVVETAAGKLCRMRVVHLGLWKVKEDADPAMLERAREKVEAFREIVPGCLEATVGPLYLPEMGKGDKDTFGNLADWKEMARGYNYILYTVWESEAARQNYEEHPAHLSLQEECLAVWIGDASESALVFDLRLP